MKVENIPNSNLISPLVFEVFIHSLPEVNLPHRCIYVAHASRALESQDLSREGINNGPHTYIFDHNKNMEDLPG